MCTKQARSSRVFVCTGLNWTIASNHTRLALWKRGSTTIYSSVDQGPTELSPPTVNTAATTTTVIIKSIVIIIIIINIIIIIVITTTSELKPPLSCFDIFLTSHKTLFRYW